MTTNQFSLSDKVTKAGYMIMTSAMLALSAPAFGQTTTPGGSAGAKVGDQNITIKNNVNSNSGVMFNSGGVLTQSWLYGNGNSYSTFLPGVVGANFDNVHKTIIVYKTPDASLDSVKKQLKTILQKFKAQNDTAKVDLQKKGIKPAPSGGSQDLTVIYKDSVNNKNTIVKALPPPPTSTALNVSADCPWKIIHHKDTYIASLIPGVKSADGKPHHFNNFVIDKKGIKANMRIHMKHFGWVTADVSTPPGAKLNVVITNLKAPAGADTAALKLQLTKDFEKGYLGRELWDNATVITTECLSHAPSTPTINITIGGSITSPPPVKKKVVNTPANPCATVQAANASLTNSLSTLTQSYQKAQADSSKVTGHLRDSIANQNKAIETLKALKTPSPLKDWLWGLGGLVVGALGALGIKALGGKNDDTDPTDGGGGSNGLGGAPTSQFGGNKGTGGQNNGNSNFTNQLKLVSNRQIEDTLTEQFKAAKKLVSEYRKGTKDTAAKEQLSQKLDEVAAVLPEAFQQNAAKAFVAARYLFNIRNKELGTKDHGLLEQISKNLAGIDATATKSNMGQQAANFVLRNAGKASDVQGEPSRNLAQAYNQSAPRQALVA